MNYEIPRDLQMPYLRAIQKIPGDTASEKLSWIGRLASHQTNGDLEQLPPELLPILHVKTAVKQKRHEDITLALKSEDSTIINRALKAAWFFDGSHKKIIDVSYFCEHLFPYVSVNTRTRIIFALAHRLSGKDPIFAQQMFAAVSSVYNIQTAYPLIIACDETFVYKTIVEKELVLPVQIVKKIFRKNPDLIVRFLKLLKPHKLKETERTAFAIGIDRYKHFLPKLIKKRLEAFVELYETHLPNITLNNTYSEIFLRKARQHLIKKPSLYVRILPLEKINEDVIESIFPDLLPEEISSFNLHSMLRYLEHYPRDKKYDLLHKSYKNKYHTDLLDESKNVTTDLLKLLPAEERIKQARIKIEKQKEISEEEISEAGTFIFISSCGDSETYCDYMMKDYTKAWICYLPVNEVIPVIKEKINKTSNEEVRLSLIVQMIYVCKINEDDDALSDILTYILNRHKNENPWIIEQIFYELSQIYDVHHLSEKQISLVLDMARLFYVKNGYVSEDILVDIIYFKLIHNMPIEDELINMFLENNLEKNNQRYGINFNLSRESQYPQYKRQYLITFANAFQKKVFKDQDEKRYKTFRFVDTIYNFNKQNKRSRIEKLTIRDYPWIMDTILEAIRSKQDISKLKSVLRENESELYHSWFPKTRTVPKLVPALLKRDLQNILNNWEDYLAECMKNCRLKRVQRFVKATRWYKDLPIKFADRCMNYIHDKNTDKISSSIVILASLLHGDVVTKLFDSLIPVAKPVDTDHPNARDNYKIVRYLPMSMRLSNPLMSLDLIGRLCKEDYLSVALMTLTNVSRRISLPKVISIVQKLMSMRVSARKHGIRLMRLVASARELTDFLQYAWTTESDRSIRQVLFTTFQNFFITNPNSETWSLYHQVILTLNLEDEWLLLELQLFPEIPNKYIVEYLKLWLRTVDNFREMGLEVYETNSYITNYLKTLNTAVFNLLPEEFAENLFRRFLFHMSIDVFNAARPLMISYILSEDMDKHAARIQVFADIFRNAVKIYWNVPHPKKLRYYPVNRAVNLFMNDFIFSYVDKFCFNSINSQSIDNMQTIFLSILSPNQDAKSYLLLTYTKMLQECISTKTSLGLILGQQLHELTDIFSSRLVAFMAEVFEYFLDRVYLKPMSDEIYLSRLSIIEGLVEAGNTASCFMAVTMLPSTFKMKNIARYERLVEKFREMEVPVATVLYERLNKTEFKIID